MGKSVLANPASRCVCKTVAANTTGFEVETQTPGWVVGARESSNTAQKLDDCSPRDQCVKRYDARLGNIGAADIVLSLLAKTLFRWERLNANPVRIDVSPARKARPAGARHHDPPCSHRRFSGAHTKGASHVEQEDGLIVGKPIE